MHKGWSAGKTSRGRGIEVLFLGGIARGDAIKTEPWGIAEAPVVSKTETV